MMASLSEMNDAVSANDGTCTMDEQTLHQTPLPRAASTSLRKNLPRKEMFNELLSFLSPEMEESGQSSFGLLPCNLILDSSAFSMSSTVNKSRKLSSLPPIPESPKHSDCSPAVPSVMTEAGDDPSIKAENRISVVSGDGVSVKSSIISSEAKFSISDLSTIDFRDDQISARSSVAESCCQQSCGAKENESSMPSTFSKLFSRNSLDVSAFTTPLQVQPQKSGMEAAEPLVIAAQKDNNDHMVEKSANTSFIDPPIALNEVNADIRSKEEDLKFFYDLGEMGSRVSSHNSDEFIKGEDILAVLENDERIFEKDHFVLLPHQPSNDCLENGMEHVISAALGSSWISSANNQDITRPSWFSDEDGSRISMGKFISARTENLGKWDDEVSKVEDGPDFGLHSVVSIQNSVESLPVQSEASKMHPNATSKQEADANKEVLKDVKKEVSVLSRSAISLLLGEASLNADLNELADLVVAADIKRLKDSRETSSTSSNEKIESCHKNETLTTGGRKLCQSLPIRKEDKVVQVSLESDQRPKPSLQYTYPALSCSDMTSVNSKPINVASSSISQFQNTVLLKLLQADLNVDSKPSVVLPEELIIEESCCVGVSVESSLEMENSSSKWLESNIVVQKITCNGQSWNVEEMPPIIRFNALSLLEPNAKHHLKVVFVPPKEGRWEAKLQIYFRNLFLLNKLTTQSSLFNWCSYPPVSFAANAENPSLKVIPSDVLDFGILPEECLSTCHLQLLNNGGAKLPIRLVIEGSPGAGQGFYFPNGSNSASFAMRVVSSCVLSCILSPANCFSAKIPISFKAQTLPHTEDSVTVSAGLRIELDTPTPLPMLLKLSLRAVVGVVKLYTRPEDELIELQYPSLATRTIPLRNAGAIPLKMELSTLDTQQLSVTPNNVHLSPGEQINVQLAYNPLGFQKSLQSCLQIKVLPGGSTYTIAVGGSVCSSSSQAAIVDKFLLYSDRRFLYWGAVDLGRAIIQQFTLRNVSVSEQLCLNLRIKMDEGCEDGEPFQMIDTANSQPSKLVSHRFVTMNPTEELPVRIYFAPLRVTSYSAKLIIRPRRPAQHITVPTVPWMKFSIPLHGYGGLAALEYEGLKSTDLLAPLSLHLPNAFGPPVVITALTATTTKTVVSRTDRQFSFTVRNSGQRAAFVKVIPSNDKNTVVSLPSWISLNIQPSEFVVVEGHSHTVKVFVDAQHQSSVFFLIIFYGEEVLRQRYRMLPLPATSVPEDAVLRNVLKLHDMFPNELPYKSDTLDSLWPMSSADRSQLVSSLRTTLVMVQPVIHPMNAAQSTQYCSALDCVVDENLNGRFVPLEAESTFADITLPPRMVPTSPPIKEKSPFTTRGEGLIQVEPTSAAFPRTACGHSSTVKITLKNVYSSQNLEVTILKPVNPFQVNHSQVIIKPKHYLSLPVTFRPTEAGSFSATLLLCPNAGPNAVALAVSLRGEGT